MATLKQSESVSEPGPRQPDALSRLLGISQLMVTQTDLNQLLSLILSEATRLMQVERSTLYLVDEPAGELISFISQGAEVQEIRLPIGKGVAGKVAASGETINLQDAYESEDFDRRWDQRTGFRTRSVLCVPMMNAERQMVGVLQVLNRAEEGGFSQDDESTLSLFASYAAVAIDNVQLHQDLKSVFLSGMRTLAEAVDQRDPVTAGHSERVTFYAVRIAQAMGLPPEEVTALEYAATLHDVGKIAMPDAILTKPDRLTKEEFDTIKGHALISRKILEKFHFTGGNRTVPFIAGAHHERLDGSGYPDGLSGDALPLAARILAVADVYDALTSFDRPYRRAMSEKEALAVLQEEAGTKLDAGVVKTCIEKQLFKIERRHFVRIDMAAYLGYNILPRDRYDSDIANAEGEMKNISGNGLLFVSTEYVPAGSYLEVAVHIGKDIIELLAKVVRIERVGESKDFEVHIQFLELSELDEQRLQDYLVKTSIA